MFVLHVEYTPFAVLHVGYGTVLHVEYRQKSFFIICKNAKERIKERYKEIYLQMHSQGKNLFPFLFIYSIMNIEIE
ncbi:hypothetical protein A3781_09535 [Bacillus badius]|nr:hypothetical protein A3781_09535 [Bacillus badius]